MYYPHNISWPWLEQTSRKYGKGKDKGKGVVASSCTFPALCLPLCLSMVQRSIVKMQNLDINLNLVVLHPA